MSDDFDQSHETQFSSFVPLLIILLGLLAWFSVQDFELGRQSSATQKQINEVMPRLAEDQQIFDLYVALMKDLAETSKKDADAAQIVRECIQAGLYNVQQGGAGQQAPASTTGTNR
jgi:hypothetical protein